jgi:hypothetical protein
MNFLPANSSADPNLEAKKALESAIVDVFAQILGLTFDPTIAEISGCARSEYLRNKINSAKDQLEKLRRIQQKEKAVVARRREIEADNARRRPKRP